MLRRRAERVGALLLLAAVLAAPGRAGAFCPPDPEGQDVPHEGNCADGVDDDADNAVDCADVDCKSTAACQTDTTPPVVVVDQPANGSVHAAAEVTARFGASDDRPLPAPDAGGFTTLRWSLDGAADVPVPASACAGGSGLCSVPLRVGFGAHTLRVRATDAAGNVGEKTVSFSRSGAPPCAYPACWVSGALEFHPVPACRRLDSRVARTPLPGTTPTRVAMTGHCGVPADAVAVAFNLATVDSSHDGWIAAYAGDAPTTPFVTTVIANVGKIRAASTVAKLAADGTGTIALYYGAGGPGVSTHYVIDVSGYYLPADDALGCTITGPTSVRAGERFDLAWTTTGTVTSVAWQWTQDATHDRLRRLASDGEVRDVPDASAAAPSGGWDGVAKLPGDQPSTVTLTVTGAGGTATCAHTVQLSGAAPVLSCQLAAPTLVGWGEPFALSATVTGGTATMLHERWAGGAAWDRPRHRDPVDGTLSAVPSNGPPDPAIWASLVKLRGHQPSRVTLSASNATHVAVCTKEIALADTSTCTFPGCWAAGPLEFFPVPACRRIDSRSAGTPLVGGTPLTVAVTGFCGIPWDAKAVSMTATAVDAGAEHDLTIYPGDAPGAAVPVLTTLAGGIRAAATVTRLATNGRGTIALLSGAPAGTTTHYVLDVNGYFK